eukprot:GHVU01127806.1.p3 GENE.GHVU01127806.1~~GHVU01127806.1.p3  ORF type:complete len:158 (-),score=18.02 GHVU01127806.1:28-501(-)
MSVSGARVPVGTLLVQQGFHVSLLVSFVVWLLSRVCLCAHIHLFVTHSSLPSIDCRRCRRCVGWRLSIGRVIIITLFIVVVITTLFIVIAIVVAIVIISRAATSTDAATTSGRASCCSELQRRCLPGAAYSPCSQPRSFASPNGNGQRLHLGKQAGC